MDAENVVSGGIRHRSYQVLSALETMDITRPDAPKGFVTRLAEENGWTIERAEAADREYRRFLMLAWSTDEMVVPSKDVDAAWHEHLLHTRHYWDATCRDILGKRFHHDPGDGSPVDAETHAAGYARTLGIYEQVFGEAAPIDVWPRGCSCAPAPARTAEVELAMPVWTVLAAMAIVTLMITREVMGYMVASAFALTAVIAAIARAQSRTPMAKTSRNDDHAERRALERRALNKVTRVPAVNMTKSRSSASGSSGKRRDERSRSTDDAAMGAVWISDSATASPSADTSYCAPTPSHSSHSSGCDTGSSSSHSSHSSCGSSSSHSSCGSSSSSSSCGGSSCGGGGCGGS